MPEEPEEYDIYFSKFAVGDKPYCVWERDLAKRNLEYLESLDPTYFEYVAEVNGAQLDATDPSARPHAAVAIRFAYHHGLETSSRSSSPPCRPPTAWSVGCSATTQNR